MVDLADRVLNISNIDVRYIVAMSDDVALSGEYQGVSGRFFEIRVLHGGHRTGSDRPIWREFILNKFPYTSTYHAQGRAFCDVAIDPTSNEVFLCLGSDDVFCIYHLRENSIPRIQNMPKQPLSASESKGLMALQLGKPPYEMIQPPTTLLRMGLSIKEVALQVTDGELRVSVRQARSGPSREFRYSVAGKRWVGDR